MMLPHKEDVVVQMEEEFGVAKFTNEDFLELLLLLFSGGLLPHEWVGQFECTLVL